MKHLTLEYCHNLHFDTNGFGYDPIFIVDKLGKTFAELSADEKNTVSHRGRAFAQVSAFLQTNFPNN